MPGAFLKIIVPVVLVAAVVIAVVFWTSAEPATDRERILSNITDAERAAERSSISGLMAVVSDDYEDRAGYTKHQLTRLAAGALRQRDWELAVQLRDIGIEESTATTDLLVTVWPPGSPEARRQYEITLQWAKEHGRWRVIRASGWQSMGPDLVPAIPGPPRPPELP